jgi:uncharacterized protein with ATP-grasp and redox domains
LFALFTLKTDPTMTNHVSLQRPSPLRVDSNPFATRTMDTRIPKILRDVQAANPDYPPQIHDAIEQLRHELENSHLIPMLSPLWASDYEAWAKAYQQQAQMVSTLTWGNCEWFFAETYLYRYLMETVRWFETNRDPFAPAKHQEFENPRLWQLLEQTQSLTGDVDEKWSALMGHDLWGNRVDLSHSASQSIGHEDADENDLLADHRPQVIEHLLAFSQKRPPIVHMVCDNAGVELALDLALVDGLLAGGVEQVVMHLKAHPTFVSDALTDDVWHLIAAMEKHEGSSRQLAQRLRAYWKEWRLRFVPHFYWNSSSFLWDMPATLTQLFRDAALVIFKGDANYRRVVGDALWNPETPFAEVVSYFNAPLMALRTLKSDSVVGLPAGLAQELDKLDPEWRVNGKRGVIQFSPKS